MYLKNSWIEFILLVCLTSNVIVGGSDEQAVDMTNDVVDEVSIESVDVDNLPQSISSLLIEKSESDSIFNTPSSTLPTTYESSENSTAVATVYTDISGNISGSNGTSGGNSTVNSTTPSKYLRVKVACSQLYPEDTNSSDLNVGTVEIINMTHLLHGLLVNNPTIKTRSTPSNCTVVLFYAYWCPWSAKAAPHFNALPRAFRNIRFAAIDSSIYTAINTYFGVLSVPSVVLFYNGKILAKFNETTFSVNQFADFLSIFTDQKPGIRLNVTSADFIGPIPSSVSKSHDWYLYLSWIFIIACSVYYMSKTSLWHRILELVQNSWREAEAVASVPPQHFHQD